MYALPTWRTYAAVGAIAVFTLGIVAALLSSYPVYLTRDQTCVIPGTGSVGAIVCDGKTLDAPTQTFAVFCPSASSCPSLNYSNGLRLTFNTSLAGSLSLVYAANQTVSMSLTCPCGTSFAATQQSIHTSYPVTGGTYTLLLTNHNAGPVKVSWTVYISRWGGPHTGFLSKYFGLRSP